MALPEHIAEPVRRALEEHHLGRRIQEAAEVGGGCINHGARILTDTGASLFLKWNDGAPVAMFSDEADGLRALARAGPLRVPAPIAWSAPPRDDHEPDGKPTPSWLLIEYVPPGPTTPGVEERLGEGLAAIHSSGGSLSDAFGWRRDNWIGSLPQANEPMRSWADFWRDRRIAPQLERAREHGHLADGVFDRVVDSMDVALADIETPDLLHGDLWAGNWFASAAEEPVLIDPAVYLGHGEVDLAMSELFGGFGRRFYEAYRAARGVDEAYDDFRRDLYQLYYLLVHVNLFGASYEAGSLRAARRVTGALGRTT
jgi:protein-ribulosamine 3-kinase